MLKVPCKICGKEVSSDAKFCSSCGAVIQVQTAQQEPPPQVPARQSGVASSAVQSSSLPPPPAYVFTPPAPPPPAASVSAAKPPPPPADVPPVGHPNAVSSVQAEQATSETLKREAAELERLEKLRLEKERLEQAQREEEARRLKEAERLELERKAKEAERLAEEVRYLARKERERAEREQRELEAAMQREREEREFRERAERERIEREMRENEQKQKIAQENRNEERLLAQSLSSNQPSPQLDRQSHSGDGNPSRGQIKKELIGLSNSFFACLAFELVVWRFQANGPFSEIEDLTDLGFSLAGLFLSLWFVYFAIKIQAVNKGKAGWALAICILCGVFAPAEFLLHESYPYPLNWADWVSVAMNLPEAVIAYLIYARAKESRVELSQ